jgi:hypothetical protein
MVIASYFLPGLQGESGGKSYAKNLEKLTVWLEMPMYRWG